MIARFTPAVMRVGASTHPTWALALLLCVGGCMGPAEDAVPPDDRPASDSPRQADGAPQRVPLAARQLMHEGESARQTAGLRTWTAPDGTVLAEGELVDLIDDRVCLRTATGEGIVVPLHQLGAADREYVREQLGEASNDDEKVGTSTSPGPPVDAVNQPPLSRFADVVSPGEKKVVIPFDFISKFDQGRYGRKLGEMIWQKLERQGGFVIPETMLDVRETCQSNRLQPSPKTALDEMQTLVRDKFAAQIGIWGSVERAAGQQSDVYDLVIKCVDFSAEPEVIYEINVRTDSVSEIPHVYVAEMLDRLYGRRSVATAAPDPVAEENWRYNPNLVAGDFEQGAAGVPAGWATHWEAGYEDQREAVGRTVQWQPETDNSDNRTIRFTFDKSLGDTTGVAYYSDFFPIEANARYRFQCRWRTDGPKCKAFVKCYAPVDGGDPSGDDVPEAEHLREVYRSQQNLDGPTNVWNTKTEDFTPKHTRYTPRFARAMLYAYLAGGTVEFDDVVVKQVVPAPTGKSD